MVISVPIPHESPLITEDERRSIMVPHLPDYITPGQAKRFAQHIVDFLNEKEVTDEPITLDTVERVELKAGQARVACKGTAQVPNSWGAGATINPEHWHTTNNDTERTLPWSEELGIDPMSTMEIILYGPYMQVTGFITGPTARVLKHEGGTGYQKYTIDIPIVENGDSK